MHYLYLTDEGRPFISRFLCDLGGSGRHEPDRTARNIWEGVDCPRCLAAGQETIDAVQALPDAALIAMGAWHDDM